MDKLKERWADIPGYEGLYQVSDQGRVKHLVYGKVKQERILKNNNHPGGYLMVVLSRNGKEKNCLVHRLVALAFIGDRPDLSINHKDGNKRNNRPSNLEYLTLADNNKHARENGLARYAIGEKVGLAKLKASEVAEIKRMFRSSKDVNLAKIAERYGVGYGTIHAIFTGRTWKHVNG